MTSRNYWIAKQLKLRLGIIICLLAPFLAFVSLYVGYTQDSPVSILGLFTAYGLLACGLWFIVSHLSSEVRLLAFGMALLCYGIALYASVKLLHYPRCSALGWYAPMVGIPATLLGFILLPFGFHRLRSTNVPGKCRKCRYDLRGLPIARCPECGTPFEDRSLHTGPGASTPVNQE